MQIEDQELRAELQTIHLRAVQTQLATKLIRSPVFLIFTMLAPDFILIGVVWGGVLAFSRRLTNITDAANNRVFSEHATK